MLFREKHKCLSTTAWHGAVGAAGAEATLCDAFTANKMRCGGCTWRGAPIPGYEGLRLTVGLGCCSWLALQGQGHRRPCWARGTGWALGTWHARHPRQARQTPRPGHPRLPHGALQSLEAGGALGARESVLAWWAGRAWVPTGALRAGLPGGPAGAFGALQAFGAFAATLSRGADRPDRAPLTGRAGRARFPLLSFLSLVASGTRGSLLSSVTFRTSGARRT